VFVKGIGNYYFSYELRMLTQIPNTVIELRSDLKKFRQSRFLPSFSIDKDQDTAIIHLGSSLKRSNKTSENYPTPKTNHLRPWLIVLNVHHENDAAGIRMYQV
jgi:hypothetical protein